ncbi:hypothetical protein CERSUDRAFT_114989 [Gelatoporia subvermispora B]|uniref:RING-type domain-containing protein n=1 Tax=Ceriporiopsis subvermispora (strain B) TaxID=914234 RepID=M2QJ66_CERS8|nr:hypothetical protein CERSUDRAFT_114989 [Gelatoporia subvermispora B]
MSSPARAAAAIRTAGTSRATSSGPSARPILGQKRVLSDSEDTSETGAPRTKKAEPVVADTLDRKRDKRKRRKKKRKMSVVVSGEGDAQEVVPVASGSGSRTLHSGHLAIPTPPVAPLAGASHQCTTAMAAPQSSSALLTRAKSATPQLMPSSDKGKGRAPEEPDSRPPPNQTSELVDLTAEVTAKPSLIEQHEALLSTFQETLTCQICLDLMHSPYALAPCGHSACYACLVNWFSTPPADMPADELPPVWARRKICPHCRAVVRERPVLMWGIRDLVSALHKSGLVAGLLPAPPPDAVADGDADPWVNIFRPARGTRNAPFPWLAAGADAGPPPPHLVGVQDVEDGGIFRCVDCLHEIWDGVCTQCGRLYPGNPDAEDEWSDEIEEEEHLMGGSFGQLMGGLGHLLLGRGVTYDDEDEGMSAYEGFTDDEVHLGPIGGAHGHVLVGPRAPLLVDLTDDEDAAHISERDDEHGSGDDDEDEDVDMDDEEGYESSFIDDDDDNVDAGALFRFPSRGGHIRTIDLTDNESDETYGEQRSPPRQNRAVPGVQAHGSRYRIPHLGSSDNDDDGGGDGDGDGDEIVHHRRSASAIRESRTMAQAVSFRFDDDDDDDDHDLAAEVAERERDLYGDDGSVPRSGRITIFSDEDEEDED